MRKISIVVTVFIVSLAIAYFIRDVRTYLAIKEIQSEPHMSWALAYVPVINLKADLVRTLIISAAAILFEWLFLMVLPTDEKQDSDTAGHRQ